ncbi:zinc finger and BTB domain-containing protein 14-like isoform X1 [Ctenocephalides felis]|uniref:zinc finger and BTB domain-containing protein 14-like isoform X1 n=1 Tax=Ctenocephalides felis TaxID=7515 RepID=UPI000E6E29E6|nr:zinc finger and BTB domain-containing protein 14-like isoform X1 [Ctenocephalides felis]
MDAEQFSLKWNNFHSNLTSGFHALLRGEDLVDVTFAVEGKFLQAHKLVLSVCSPYFKQMFKIHPDKHPIIILKGVAYSDMSDILLFMYQGEVNVRQENLANFLKTAELLQIKGLTEDESSNDNPKPDATNEKDNTSESLTQYMYQDKQKNDTSTINSSSNLQNDAPKRPVVSPPANSETKRLKVANKPEENALVEPTDMTFIPKTEPNFMDEDYESSSMGDFTQIMESAQKDMNMASSGMSPLASSVLQDSSQLLDHVGTRPNDQQGLDLKLAEHLKQAIKNCLDDTYSKEFYCPICPKTYIMKGRLVSHLYMEHDLNVHRYNNVEPKRCDICGNVYKNSNTLRVHIYMAHRKGKNGSNNTSTAATNPSTSTSGM